MFDKGGPPCIKHLKTGERDGWGQTEREKDRAAGWRANVLGFTQKCQMSQRHSGKTLLFNMAPQSATEAANLQ